MGEFSGCGNFPRGEFFEGEFSVGEIFQVGIIPGGSFPRTAIVYAHLLPVFCFIFAYNYHNVIPLSFSPVQNEKKITLVVRETSVSRHNGGVIEDPLNPLI